MPGGAGYDCEEYGEARDCGENDDGQMDLVEEQPLSLAVHSCKVVHNGPPAVVDQHLGLEEEQQPAGEGGEMRSG